MKMFLINENGADVVDIPNTIEDINKTLGWDDAWNVATIKILNHKYLVICSDLGKVKHLPVSIMCKDNLLFKTSTIIEPFFVGSVLITKFDGIDDFITLNERDIQILSSRVIEAHYFGIESYKKVLICG